MVILQLISWTEMNGQMNSIIIAALCCAGISFTITTTSIFKFLRDWVSDIHPKLDELIHCPWCFNHYVVLSYLFLTTDFAESNFVGFMTAWFTVVCLGGCIHYILLRAYEPVAKATAVRNLQKKTKNDRMDSEHNL